MRYNQDNAYGSIKEAIELITRAIEGILPENRKNALGSFQAVNLAVSHYVGWKRMKKVLDFYGWIRKLIP